MMNLRHLVTLSLVILIVSANADNTQTLDKIIHLEQKAIKEAQSSQQHVDQMATATEKLFEEYKRVNKQTASLRVYNAQLKRKIDNQKQYLKGLTKSMDQASLVERQISPLLEKMLYSLDRFIDLDLPFHLGERKQRIDQLLSNQNRPDLNISERFRQVLEAYKIEIEFGRTMDTYRQTINLNADEKEVVILRIGRIALLFQTQDKHLAGFWNQEQKAWQAITERHYQTAIAQGIRMIKKQASLDILTVPVRAAGPLK